MITRLLLVGMSGAGKSTIGEIVAAQLGWRFVDMDDSIEASAGRTVPEIFAEDGEPAFRAMEQELLVKLLTEANIVISTGGGATSNEAAQHAIRESTGSLSAWLHAEAEELLRRVNAHQDASRTTARPMLVGDEPLQRMQALIANRTQFYGAADVTIPVGSREATATAADLTELVNLANGISSDVLLDTGKVQSQIRVGQGIASTLPEVIRAHWPKAQAIWFGADANVARAHSAWLERMEQEIGLPVHVYEVPSGETSKSLASYGDILGWMLEGGVQRSDVVIALGGGVVGDLMGFAAASVLRGIGLVQIPTTLLSMVDSSVGGKTGINHPAGKNLIGAFYQPPVVLVDPHFLSTVPDRELRSGFGEIIKHGVIQASTPGGEAGFLSEILRLNSAGLLQLNEPLTSWVLRQNVSLKASVVAEDEKEADLRQILNFGHTIGHGIEAAEYNLLHGEAIAVGMIAVSAIAVRKGLVSQDWADALRDVIWSFTLPVTARADRENVIAKMQSDKKKSSGRQNWVLPRAEGGVFVTTDVSSDDIVAAIDMVLQGS